MGNIWAFLLQTASVTVVAVFLLVVKRIFADKLSPRWQYGVWSLLVLRILWPVDVYRNILLPLPLWIETWKSYAEENLASAYCAVYEPVSAKHVLPVVSGIPASATDWLFVIYAAGVLLCAGWYAVSYFRLRSRLKRGTRVSEAVRQQIDTAARQYGLKACPAVAVTGLHSAFICGVKKPVLAVPADKEVDEKVILHELLHLKHRDSAQSIFWCALRCLHWCNPVMHLVFDRISNDMESLCDQRVLERLEGEERREYGNVLLRMANEKYARVPGTTSVSNGGKNIARRITAIVRFKKYPRGMALVSVCILVLLFNPVLVGVGASYDSGLFKPDPPEAVTASMAMARLNRCSTVAGALTTYAKGLMHKNAVYIAMASPLDTHPAMAKQMRRNHEDVWVAWHYESGYGLHYADAQKGFAIFNLKEKEDGSFDAVLGICTYGFWDEERQTHLEEEAGVLSDGGIVWIPVNVRHEDAWVVEETGERRISLHDRRIEEFRSPDAPDIEHKTVQTETGTVSLFWRTYYQLAGNTGSMYILPEQASTNVEFAKAVCVNTADYTFTPGENGEEPQASISIQMKILESLEEEVQFEKLQYFGGGGASSDGFSHASERRDEYWTGTVSDNNSYLWFDMEDEAVAIPAGFRIQLYWDGEIMEELTIER